MADEETKTFNLTWHNLGLQFPTKLAAQNAYAEIEKKCGGHGEDISVWRFASIPPGTDENNPNAVHRMVVISGEESKIAQVVKVAADHAATPWDIPDEVLETCTARRLRVALEAVAQQGPVGHVEQRAHYEGGGVLQRDGSVEPYKKESDGDS